MAEMNEPKPKATCNHCGHLTTERMLQRDPGGGGAVCKQWFRCQQRRDAQRAARRARGPH